jgi:hypothetical protein
MKAIVRETIDRLKRLDDDVLRALPEYAEDVTEIDGKKVVIGTHHEVLTDDSHKIVVQAIQQRWLGMMTRIEVDGFVIDRSGARRSALEQELWDFS